MKAEHQGLATEHALRPAPSGNERLPLERHLESPAAFERTHHHRSESGNARTHECSPQPFPTAVTIPNWK